MKRNPPLLVIAHKLIVVTALLLLSACALPQADLAQRYFWPLPVAGVEPKIEYLNFYQTDYDLRLNGHSWSDTYVWGKFPPEELFRNPYGVSSYDGERLFVTDTALHKVLVVDRAAQTVRALKDMDGEPHFLMMPMGVSVSADGPIFVVDSLKGKVFKYDAAEKLVAIVSNDLMLTRPVSVVVDDQNKLIYILDGGAHNVVAADWQGNLLFKFGERGSASGQFNYPTDIALDQQGNIYVLDTLNFRVQVFDPSGHFLRQFGEQGTEAGSFQIPKGLAVSPQGHVYVTDSLAHRLVVFDTAGRYLMSLGDKAYHLDDGEVSPGGFYMPRDIHVDSQGGIWVVDGGNKMLHQLQYLTDDYLEKAPILPEQIYFPPGSFAP